MFLCRSSKSNSRESPPATNFRKCPQLLRFLRFAVNEALSGRDGGSKERLIGMEVFGRPADYDAGADPVVRVEARRLRRKLDEYYAPRAGKREDELEIRLPKGGYLPTFEARPAARKKRSVAVLPFSGHALSDGLTTRLIARLSECSALRVFRFKDHTGEVELILEGTVRQAGERFRCDSQLVCSSDGLHLWAQRRLTAGMWTRSRWRMSSRSRLRGE